ncbi:uncharacterized protein LOC142546240 isoform X2 [Primulina tabacum]
MFFWILCLVLGDKLRYLFTDEEDVAQDVSNLHILLALAMLLSGFYSALSCGDRSRFANKGCTNRSHLLLFLIGLHMCFIFKSRWIQLQVVSKDGTCSLQMKTSKICITLAPRELS